MHIGDREELHSTAHLFRSSKAATSVHKKSPGSAQDLSTTARKTQLLEEYCPDPGDVHYAHLYETLSMVYFQHRE